MLVARLEGRLVDEGEKGVEFLEEELHKRVAGGNRGESTDRKPLVPNFGRTVQGFEFCYDLIVFLFGERAHVGQVLGAPYGVLFPRG